MRGKLQHSMRLTFFHCTALHCTALLERQEGINKYKILWNCSNVYLLKRVPLLHLLITDLQSGRISLL